MNNKKVKIIKLVQTTLTSELILSIDKKENKILVESNGLIGSKYYKNKYSFSMEDMYDFILDSIFSSQNKKSLSDGLIRRQTDIQNLLKTCPKAKELTPVEEVK